MTVCHVSGMMTDSIIALTSLSHKVARNNFISTIKRAIKRNEIELSRGIYLLMSCVILFSSGKSIIISLASRPQSINPSITDHKTCRLTISPALLYDYFF